MLLWLRQFANGLIFFAVVLGGCGSLEKKAPSPINCSAVQSSCHHGRLGLLWKTENSEGKLEVTSVSGTYEWRSERTAQAKTPDLAYLQIRSALGPSLGSAKRVGNFYEVRTADGRAYQANDWQSLFNLLFPIELPAQALVQWMENPSPDTLPELPEHWRWQNEGGRYRILFSEDKASGRIDLIPQGNGQQ